MSVRVATITCGTRDRDRPDSLRWTRQAVDCHHRQNRPTDADVVEPRLGTSADEQVSAIPRDYVASANAIFSIKRGGSQAMLKENGPAVITPPGQEKEPC